MLVLHILHL